MNSRKDGSTTTVVPLFRPEDELLIDGDIPPLIEPGECELAYVSHYTFLLRGRAHKLRIRFRVLSQGHAFGAEVERFYNVTRLIGRVGLNGKFNVGFHGDLVRELCRLFPEFNPRSTRLDRIPIRNLFLDKILIGQIKTVTKGRGGELLPQAQYSTVEKLLRAKVI